jgi:hypothetical protein
MRQETLGSANIIVNRLWNIRSQKGNLRALHGLLTEIWGARDNYTVPIGMTSNLNFNTRFYLNDATQCEGFSLEPREFEKVANFDSATCSEKYLQNCISGAAALDDLMKDFAENRIDSIQSKEENEELLSTIATSTILSNRENITATNTIKNKLRAAIKKKRTNSDQFTKNQSYRVEKLLKEVNNNKKMEAVFFRIVALCRMKQGLYDSSLDLMTGKKNF